MIKLENYKVEKIKTTVDILMDDGNNELCGYNIYLNKYSRYKKGKESISELIESKKFVIPVIKEDGKDFLILNKNEIVYIKEREVSLIQNQKNIKLFLKNNIVLEAELLKIHKDSRARVLDYFNTDNIFLEFIYNDAKIYINKNKVIKVSE